MFEECTLALHEAIADGLSDFVPRNVDGSQRRIAELSQLDVVEACNGNVLRNAATAFAQFSKRPHRHQVVDANDRGSARVRGEQRSCSAASALESIGICCFLYLEIGVVRNRIDQYAEALIDRPRDGRPGSCTSSSVARRPGVRPKVAEVTTSGRPEPASADPRASIARVSVSTTAAIKLAGNARRSPPTRIRKRVATLARENP